MRRKNAKNSKSRNVPLKASVVEVLRRRNPAGYGLVFHRENGQPLYQTGSTSRRQEDLRRLLKMPADFVAHSFRHT